MNKERMKKGAVGTMLIAGSVAGMGGQVFADTGIQAEQQTQEKAHIKPETKAQAKEALDVATANRDYEQGKKNEAEKKYNAADSAHTKAAMDHESAKTTLAKADADAKSGFAGVVDKYTGKLEESKANEANAKTSLDEAVKTQAEKQTALDNAIKEKKDAENALKEAEAKYPNADATIEQDKTAVEGAKAEQETSNQKLSEATANLNKAKADLETATGVRANTAAAVEAAKTEVEAAKANVTAKQNELNDAKAKLAALTDGSPEYQAAVTKVQTAEANLNTAKGVLANKQSVQTSKQGAYTNAEAKYNSALASVQEYQNLKIALEQAKQDRASAETNRTEKMQSLTDANNAVRTAEDELKTLKNDVETKTNAVNTAKTELDNANEAVKTAQAKYDKSVADAKAELATAKTALSKAGVEFLDSLATFKKMEQWNQALKNTSDTKIQKFFELLGDKPYTDDDGNTEKNADGSVKTIWQQRIESLSSPEALLKAMDMIDQVNERIARNDQPYGPKTIAKVNADMMLYSMISNALCMNMDAHSLVRTKDSGLAGPDALSECQAFGYPSVDAMVRGWYEDEKAEYDAGNRNFQEVGHYLIIRGAGGKDAVVGGSVSELGNGTVNFTDDNARLYANGMTTDEFRAQLHDFVEAKQNAVANAQDKLNDLINNETPELRDAKADLASKEEAKTNADNQLANANKAVSDKEQEIATLDQKRTEADKALDEATSKLNAIITVESAAQKAVTDYEAANPTVATMVSDAEQAMNTAKAELDDATREVETAQADVDAKTEALETAKTELKEMNAEAAKAQEKVDEATTNLNAAIERAKTAYEAAIEAGKADIEAQKDVTAKTAERDNKQTAYDTAVADLADKTDKVKTAEDKLSGDMQKFAELFTAREVLENKTNAFNEATTNLDVAKADVEAKTKAHDEAVANVAKAEDMLAKAKLVKRDDPSTYKDNFPELVELEKALADAKAHEAETAKALEVAKAELDKAKADYDNAKARYAEALADYTVAKADYDSFVKAEKQKAKRGNKRHGKVVKTGDENDLGLAALGLFGAGAALVATKKRKKQIED